MSEHLVPILPAVSGLVQVTYTVFPYFTSYDMLVKYCVKRLVHLVHLISLIIIKDFTLRKEKGKKKKTQEYLT